MILKFGSESKPVDCLFNKIGPNQDSKILTKNLTKKYNVVNRKGLISNDFRLYPFGFV
jgi:hypothetical protein